MSKQTNNKSNQIWFIVLVFATITCVIAWKERLDRMAFIEKQEAYMVGAEGFRVTHHDADIPMSPKSIVWTDNGHGDYTLEADGSQLVGKVMKPRRWVVKMHHGDSRWSMVTSNWK
jgi:hypothetical protein